MPHAGVRITAWVLLAPHKQTALQSLIYTPDNVMPPEASVFFQGRHTGAAAMCQSVYSCTICVYPQQLAGQVGGFRAYARPV